ncbi:MAG: AmmeMemoRadiSam system protein A [Mycoplasmataceae bacterium]|jgi:AmmeMemoRadiSam system protein A|nr:AmmeMemoRadiSam system protein A [Mycoplasmataceae bacterium]
MNGYILPHPPLIFEDIGKDTDILKTKDTYNTVKQEIADEKPDVVIVISPHGRVFYDGFNVNCGKNFLDDLKNFGSKVNVNVGIDTELSKLIIDIARKNNLIAGWGEKVAHDHGSIIPISLLGLTTIVNICPAYGLSLVEHYRFGMAIAQACQQLNKKYVVIASGDMSHHLAKNENDSSYKFNKYGPVFENLIQEKISKNNVVEALTLDGKFIEEIGTCALKPLAILYGIFDGCKINSSLLSYEAPYGVGYLCAKFSSTEKCETLFLKLKDAATTTINEIRTHEDEFIKLARNTIEIFVKYHKKIQLPIDVPDSLREKGGVFVSIHTYDSNELRGCIGTIIPVTECIGQEIINNAISAASKDNRFMSVIKDELENLIYNVDVLSEMQLEPNWHKLNPKKYGVLIRNNYKSGVLLPNLEGVNSIEEAVDIALKKGRFLPNELFEVYKFTTERHEISEHILLKKLKQY